MERVDRGSRRIDGCVNRMYDRSRTDSGCHDKGLSAEAANKVAYTSSSAVGLDVTLIPREAKRCIRQLNHEEVELCVWRQANHFDMHVLHRTAGTNGYTSCGVQKATCRRSATG